MSISLTTQCPYCGMRYAVSTERIGHELTCASCNHSFRIRQVPREPDAPALVSARPDARQIDAPMVNTKSVDEFATIAHVQQESQPDSNNHEFEYQPGERVGPGMQVGAYAIEFLLGRGGMGEVWLAHDQTLDRKVAMKFLPPDYTEVPSRLARFQREAKLAAQIQHPNVVAIYQAGLHNGLAFLVMEYVDGGSLDRLIARDKPLHWLEATTVLRDTLMGLREAHAKGLVHRDLKPANLMRSSSGITKIADFGLARDSTVSTELTQQGVILGTPGYLAPELWLGQEASPQSDLYALACTYYCLLAGRPPFEGSREVSLGYLHQHEAPANIVQFAPQAPPAVTRILELGLAKDPAQRVASAAAYLLEVEELLSASDPALPPVQAAGVRLLGQEQCVAPLQAMTATPPRALAARGVVHIPHSRRRRRSAAPAVVLVGSVVLMIGIALYAWANRDKPVENGSEQVASSTSQEESKVKPVAPDAGIDAALEAITQREFIEKPLRDFFDYVSDQHRVEVQIDHFAVQDAGVAADYSITKNLRGLSLRSALALALSDHGLTYVVDDNAVIITTPEGAKTLDDRPHPPPRRGAPDPRMRGGRPPFDRPPPPPPR